MNSETPLTSAYFNSVAKNRHPIRWPHAEDVRFARSLERRLNAATEFINSFSVSNSCECHTCRAMRKYNETIKQLEQQ